jgi:O-acetyl-ADP-ribose deacetylase
MISCYSNTLAAEKGFKSVSMPAISSGIFGFPKDKCAKTLVNESIGFLLNRNTASIETVEFCLIDSETLHCFKIEFDNIK